MATVPFLRRGRTSLYVSVFIPRTLQRHFKNKRELWRTLQTLDASEAVWKAAAVEAGTSDRRTGEVFCSHWWRQADRHHGCRWAHAQAEPTRGAEAELGYLSEASVHALRR